MSRSEEFAALLRQMTDEQLNAFALSVFRKLSQSDKERIVRKIDEFAGD